jgi:hypothetical protein
MGFIGISYAVEKISNFRTIQEVISFLLYFDTYSIFIILKMSSTSNKFIKSNMDNIMESIYMIDFEIFQQINISHIHLNNYLFALRKCYIEQFKNIHKKNMISLFILDIHFELIIDDNINDIFDCDQNSFNIEEDESLYNTCKFKIIFNNNEKDSLIENQMCYSFKTLKFINCKNNIQINFGLGSKDSIISSSCITISKLDIIENLCIISNNKYTSVINANFYIIYIHIENEKFDDTLDNTKQKLLRNIDNELFISIKSISVPCFKIMNSNINFVYYNKRKTIFNNSTLYTKNSTKNNNNNSNSDDQILVRNDRFPNYHTDSIKINDWNKAITSQ